MENPSRMIPVGAILVIAGLLVLGALFLYCHVTALKDSQITGHAKLNGGSSLVMDDAQENDNTEADDASD